MTEEEIAAAFVSRPVDLFHAQTPRKRVDVRKVHLPESFETVAVEIRSRRVRIDDVACFAINKQLHRAVLFEHLSISQFARLQVRCGAAASPSLDQQKRD